MNCATKQVRTKSATGQLLDPERIGREAQRLEEELRARIIGQQEAIAQVVGVYQTYLAGLNGAGRPVGTFLFMGPTGTGKTRVVEAASEVLAGDIRAMVKIDCAEFQHGHEIAKLIGSPPGYLGHRETHPMLSQETLNQYHSDTNKLSFVLFDEIEKASDTLWNLLLGILDRATLTLGDNRRVDFSRTMIFLTSNLGAAEMDAILRPKLGFAALDTERRRQCGEVDGTSLDKVARAGMEAARRKFRPEFINRIDKTVVFRPLGGKELHDILDLELRILRKRILASTGAQPFVFSVSEAAREFLLREGTDMRYGARHLKRTIEHWLVHPMSNLVATQQVRGGDLLKVEYDETSNTVTFYREQEGLTPYAMTQLSEEEDRPAAA